MRNHEKKIYVYSDWFKEIPVLLGFLYESGIRGNATYLFEYDSTWLKENFDVLSFDPDLFLYSGRQYTPFEKTMFGIFSDSCPDR